MHQIGPVHSARGVVKGVPTNWPPFAWVRRRSKGSWTGVRSDSPEWAEPGLFSDGGLMTRSAEMESGGVPEDYAWRVIECANR